MKKKTIMGTDVPVTGADTGSEKTPQSLGRFQNNRHLCNDFHIEQARRLADNSLRAFFMPMACDIVPTPVWSVNAPTACSRWKSTGKRNLFCSLSLYNQHIVSF